MLRALATLAALALFGAVIALAVANRTPVTLTLDVLHEPPRAAVELPLYAVIFAATAVGVVLGGVASWLARTPQRRQARKNADELRRLRGELTGALTAGQPFQLSGPRQSGRR